MVSGHPPLELQAAVPALFSCGGGRLLRLYACNLTCSFGPDLISDDRTIGSDSASGAKRNGSLRSIALTMHDLTISADELP